MRRLIVVLVSLIVFFTVVSCNGQSVEKTPFKVGDVYYQSLQEACDVAIANYSTSADSENIVRIVKDASGPGICINAGTDTSSLPTPLFIDFGGNSYTVTGSKTSSGTDFDLSGVLLTISGDDGGELMGSGATLLSATNTQLVIAGSLNVDVPGNSCLIAANNESGINVDAYFNGSIDGSIKLNNGMLTINCNEGSINIEKLELSGPESKLVFGDTRNSDNTTIGELLIDASQSKPAIPVTTSKILETDEYDKIDEILVNAKSEERVHRHVFKDTPDEIYLEATCCSEEYGSFKCTYSNCSMVDVRETNPVNPSNHKLVHVDAIAPTANTNGIEECQQCEWCYQFFSSTKGFEEINPILLATDNVLNSDMEAGGIDSLNTTVRELEEKLNPSNESKGVLDTVSGILTVISSAFNAVDRIEDTKAKDVQKILSGLNEINNNIKDIQQKLSGISDKLQKISDGSYYNIRISELNAFAPKTDPYYSSIIKALNGDGTESEKKAKIKEIADQWVNEKGKVILSEPTTLLLNGLKLNNEQQKNLFQVYDYIGRTSTGWEKFSLEIRVAMRAYDMLTMLEGYEMVEWYYKYCYEGDEGVKEAALKNLRDAWNKYKTLCNNNKMMTDSPNQATCWLLNFYNCTFNLTPGLVDLEGTLRRNQSKYRFPSDKKNLQKNMDRLIADANGDCSRTPLQFFSDLYTWYNKGKKNAVNIYEILEKIGFNPVDGTKLSAAYDSRKFIVANDPNRGKLSVRGTFSSVEYTYKILNVFQKSPSKRKDWFGVGSVLGKNKPLELQKIFEGSNIRSSSFEFMAKITKLGRATGNRFYRLNGETFTPVVYQK